MSCRLGALRHLLLVVLVIWLRSPGPAWFEHAHANGQPQVPVPVSSMFVAGSWDKVLMGTYIASGGPESPAAGPFDAAAWPTSLLLPANSSAGNPPGVLSPQRVSAYPSPRSGMPSDVLSVLGHTGSSVFSSDCPTPSLCWWRCAVPVTVRVSVMARPGAGLDAWLYVAGAMLTQLQINQTYQQQLCIHVNHTIQIRIKPTQQQQQETGTEQLPGQASQ